MHRADNDFNRLGIGRLLHPPYSSDLVPCDFWLLGILKNKLEGNTFANEMKVKSKVYEILMNIPLHVFISVFDEWMRRIRECIDSGGEYI
jgi:histone-lysine N-methyltransferase SETMAR